MNRIIVTLVMLLISAAMFNSVSAGTYPPAGSGKIHDIERETKAYPISKAEVFLYDTAYNLEKSYDDQIVRGLVQLRYVEADTNISVKFNLYGSPTDTTGTLPKENFLGPVPGGKTYFKFYNHVMVVIVPGYESEAQVMVRHERGTGKYEGGPAVDRVLVIRIGSQNRIEFESLLNADSPYVSVIDQKAEKR